MKSKELRGKLKSKVNSRGGSIQLKDLWKPISLGFVVVVAITSLAISVGLLSSALTKANETKDLALETAERAQVLFDNTQRTIRQADSAQARRDRFLMYGNKTIEDFYTQRRMPQSKRFAPKDQAIFLSEIWDRWESGEYSGVDPFLCLSYAMQETGFCPIAIGEAGERGPFQFMESTSKFVFERFFNEPYFNGIEENPAVAVRLWYTYYSYLYSNVHDGKMGSSEYDIEWIAIAYNTGAWTRGLATYIRAESTPEKYVRERRQEGYTYHVLLRDIYNKLLNDWDS
jgi:hypothetical protein